MATDQFNRPNVVLPMAASINVRGLSPYTSLLSGAPDQLKINCYHENLGNPVSGQTVNYLLKRPGTHVVNVGTVPAASASSGDIPFLILASNIQTSFCTDRTNASVYALNLTADGTRKAISTTSATPKYVDSVLISNSTQRVVQLSNGDTFTSDDTGSAGTSWTEISASAFADIIAVGKMEFVDGFAFILESGTGKIRNSDLNNLASWPLTGFITKTIISDVEKGLMRCGNKIVAFGEETLEIFVNAGNATGSPLNRIPNSAQRLGLADARKHYYAEISGKTYFIGSTQRYSNIGSQVQGAQRRDVGAYAFDGSSFGKISTPAIDRILMEANDAGNTGRLINHIQRIPVNGQEAVSFLLSPDNTATATWLMYFIKNNDWYIWNSQRFRPIGGGQYFVPITYSGGASSGATYYRFNTSSSQVAVDGDAAGTFDMVHQFRLPKNDNATTKMAWAGVVANSISASASTTANGEAKLYISFSDDDYQSFSTPRVIDLTQRKKQIYRCGAYQDRVVRLVHSGNAECRIQAFIAKTL